MSTKPNTKTKSRWKDGLKKVGKVYHYRFAIKGKIRHGSTGCADRTAAEKWLKHHRDTLVLCAEGIHGITTLGVLISKWKTAVANVFSKKHVEITVRQLKKHFDHMLTRPITELTHEVVQEVINDYLDCQGFSPARNGRLVPRPHTSGGVEALMRRLNTIMSYAIKLKMIGELPYFVIMSEAQEIDRPVLMACQMVNFIAHVDKSRNPHVHMAVRLMVGLGLREGEALAARWEWFHLDAGIYCGQGKQKNAHSIPIPDWLQDWLRAWPERVASGLMMPSELLDKEGNQQPHYSQFTSKAVRRAGVALGVPKLSPHGIRASFATIHDGDVGSSLGETQALMDHAPGSPVTLKHYIKRSSSRLKARQEGAAVAMGLSKKCRVYPVNSELNPVARIYNNTFQVTYK